MCKNFCILLPSKGHMFEQSPLSINVFSSASHKGDYFEEIVAEPPATIKGDYEFLSSLQSMEEIILELNVVKRKCCLRWMIGQMEALVLFQYV